MDVRYKWFIAGVHCILPLKQKLFAALAAYAVLGVLAWNTLSADPIQIGFFKGDLRTVTLVILGVFAFRTLMGFWRRKIDEERERNAK